MFNGYGQLQMLNKLDKKETYTYICLAYKTPKHPAFISVKAIEDCWEVKTKGEASENLKDFYVLNEVVSSNIS